MADTNGKLSTITITPKDVTKRQANNEAKTPYLYVPFAVNFKNQGMVDRIAMAWGNAAASVEDTLRSAAKSGDGVRVYGRFDGPTFNIIGLSAPRQKAAQDA